MAEPPEWLGGDGAFWNHLATTPAELFGLRDADSGSTEPLGSLGLVTDTYRRKAAFDTYRDVIHRCGRSPH
ncbi:hypothetical protein KZ829_19580 [Actinoplanes hulinensis]|uniref:Uncharacterized protein n=1 Tax=Actinoplanes hulinensis TaxID=1144547 RepID=A0ABS7B4I1_9ACTN|nr:hypothetical protein [Actinoplanes hulinensis]MBW6435946.1 hypothetical protein [Actinoplanes hulinensis]